MSPKQRAFSTAVALALPLDVLSKEWVIRSIARGEHRPVIDGFFYLTHVRNPGAAFSMLANAPDWFRIYFFPLMTVFALGLIVSMFRQLAPRDRLASFALGFVLGGASGNLLDRFRHGEVVDWLHVKLWNDITWPDFNFADSFVVVGVALLIFEMFASEGEGLESASPPGSGS
ncbi:MAG TPA: signal peptidase II [Myxococcota bacterium]|jgi:signal peptidase II